MADRLVVELLVDRAHRLLADGVRQAAGAEDRDAHGLPIALDRAPQERAPLVAALERGHRRLDAVEEDRHDARQPLELHAPQRNADAVVELKAMRHGWLEARVERRLRDMPGEPRMARNLAMRKRLHPRFGRTFVHF